MRRTFVLALALLAMPVGAPPVISNEQAPDPLEQWGQWRGPLATGEAPHADPPLTWSENANVRWKTPIPGLGHSTPLVWGDRVFVTTAVPHGEALKIEHPHVDGAHDNLAPSREQRFRVLALDRSSGSIVWDTKLRDEQPHEGTHTTGSWASNSPITDGERVYVSFGSRGLYALDMAGKTVWEKDLGQMQSRHGHGEGSSPALHGETLIVNWDHQGDSFLIALDKRTGKPRWKVPREEITSWSTPLVVEHEGPPQVVVSATNRVRGYDLADGKVLWQCAGLSRNVVASPVAADGYVYAGNSDDTRSMLAIRLAAASGEISGTDAVAWTLDRDTPYVPSPVLADDTLCFLKHNQAFLTCLRARTGERLLGPRRLPGIGHVFASPVVAAGRIYIASRNGRTAVLRFGGEFEQLALNALDDSFSASPAVAGRELFLRGENSLYCLAESVVSEESRALP